MKIKMPVQDFKDLITATDFDAEGEASTSQADKIIEAEPVVSSVS